MLDWIRFILAAGSLASVVTFGWKIHRLNSKRLDIERANNRLLVLLGVRVDDLHSRMTRLEHRVDTPPAEATEQRG